MSYTPVTQSAVASVRASLAAASAIVQNTDDEIAGLKVHIESLRLKAEPLFQQIAELQCNTSVVEGPDEDQVQALLADPSKPVNIGAITLLVHTARAEADATSMAVATVQAAIDRIEAEITEIDEKITALQFRREKEFRDFAVAIQSRLAPLFESEFIRLRDTVMMPLLAVSKLRASDGRTDLLSVRDPGATKFSWDSQVSLDRWQDGTSGSYGQWNPNKLFDADGLSSRQAEGVVQSFRDMLRIIAPSPKA